MGTKPFLVFLLGFALASEIKGQNYKNYQQVSNLEAKDLLGNLLLRGFRGFGPQMGFGSRHLPSRGPRLDTQGFMGHGSSHGPEHTLPGSSIGKSVFDAGGPGRYGPRFFRGNRFPVAPTSGPTSGPTSAPSPAPLPDVSSPSPAPSTSTSTVAPEPEPTLASTTVPSPGFKEDGPQRDFGFEELGYRGTRLTPNHFMGPGFSRGPEQSLLGARPPGGPRFLRGGNISPAQTESAPRPEPRDFRDSKRGLGFGFRGSGFSEGPIAARSPQGGGRLRPRFSRRGFLPAPASSPAPARTPPPTPSPALPAAFSPAPPAAPSPAPPPTPSPAPVPDDAPVDDPVLLDALKTAEDAKSALGDTSTESDVPSGQVAYPDKMIPTVEE